MIKQFSAGDITVRPFGTYKHWYVQSINSGALDQYGYTTFYNGRMDVDVGLNLSGAFYPSSSENYSPVSEPVNSSGKYCRNVYSLTDSMFYRNSGDPLKLFGVQSISQDLTTGNKEVREIHDRVVVGKLKHNLYGDTMIPESVRLLDYSNVHEPYEIYDDGYTNLRLSGSHFPTQTKIGAVRVDVATPYWITGSGEFYVTYIDGTISRVTMEQAKYYADMGLETTYVPPESGSDWAYDQSTAKDYYQADNEHFGEAVSAWYKYIAVGSSMNDHSLTEKRIGYTALYKYDDNRGYHRLIKKLNFPFTQSASGSLFEDSYGYSVSVRDNFLAVGSPLGQACATSSYPGYVCVYDKNKGGEDHWGIVNLLKGGSYGDRFGNSVSIDGDILAVGAPAYSGSGAVYIFRRKQYMNSGSCDDIPTGSYWHQVITVDDFCSELLTGSYQATQSPVPTFVSGNYFWQAEAVISSSVIAAGDNFGWCLEVSDDRLLVGTYKTGNGYATLFSCSYSSSNGACPTASWHEVAVFGATPDTGDLDMSSPLYLVDDSDTITTDYFGSSVALSGDAMVIGCLFDKKFKAYTTAPSSIVLGAAYFYNVNRVEEALRVPAPTSGSSYKYFAVANSRDCGMYKTFGGSNPPTTDNMFGYKVAVDGNIAAISSLPDTLVRTVDYVSGSYVLENYSYQSSASADSILGRVTLYRDSTGTGSWGIAGTVKRNKEAYSPYGLYGYGVSVSSDFLAVGSPVVSTASLAALTASLNEDTFTSSLSSSYSGSVYVYRLSEYTPNQQVGNVFYKNGYLVMANTSSNYQNILTGTGSLGFDLTYQGSHTIYEHEYLVSVRPGEFNYSTNPSSLVNSPLLFDVNQDGVFDYADLDLIMRYLQHKKFYDEFVFDESGIILEQDTLHDYSWWNSDLLLLESEDVLQQEFDYAYASGSLSAFTRAAYDYIQTKLVDTGILDVDGDGDINLHDGNIFVLYFIDKLNPSTLASQLNANSTRRYVKDVSAYLDQYCGYDTNRVNPDFFSYQASSSYDPTGSYLAPFVTTIGLYQNNELVAVGKLGRPIKNLIDWPVNFIVRFDT